MKPLGIKNYGSIPHLSTSKLGVGDHFIQPGQEHILTVKARDKHDTIFAFEKYDGSNVGIAKKNGEIIALTRSGYLAGTSPYKQHHVFAEWVGERSGMFGQILAEGERIVGEWLLQAHGLRYRIYRDPIVFFDWFGVDNKRKLFIELQSVSRIHGIPLPRMIHTGEPMGIDSLLPVLNNYSDRIQAMGNPEGIVYRVERKGSVDFLAKWVRPDFMPGKYIINVEDANLTYNV